MKAFYFIGLTLLSTFSIAQNTSPKNNHLSNVSLYNINGDSTNLITLGANKIVLIDCWFIPCGGCFQEMNMLHQLYNEYNNNPQIKFITITLTDSAFVRPLIENRNTDSNQTYNYFKSLANLDSFKLPVYFIKNGTQIEKSLIKKTTSYYGHGVPRNNNNANYPNKIFGFDAYPTLMIYNQKGNLVYKNTGFKIEEQKRLYYTIDLLLKSKLYNNSN